MKLIIFITSCIIFFLIVEVLILNKKIKTLKEILLNREQQAKNYEAIIDNNSKMLDNKDAIIKILEN